MCGYKISILILVLLAIMESSLKIERHFRIQSLQATSVPAYFHIPDCWQKKSMFKILPIFLGKTELFNAILGVLSMVPSYQILGDIDTFFVPETPLFKQKAET